MTLETITSEDMPDEEQEQEVAPRPPPRYKRKVKLRGVENLNLDQINISGDTDETHQNDILFKVVCGAQHSHDIVEGKIRIKKNSYIFKKSLASLCFWFAYSCRHKARVNMESIRGTK